MRQEIEFVPGRKPSPVDNRDYKLGSYIDYKEGVTQPLSKIWDFDSKSLDQSIFPHCTGFAIANWGICSPVNDKYTNADGHDFYYKCKVIDGEPKEENGSTIRSVAKVLKNEGKINTYAFSSTIDEIKYWILNKSPMIVGTEWYEGMMSTRFGFVEPTGKMLGGHAYLMIGYENGNFIFQNSWGNWGISGTGRFKMSESNFAKIFENDGEVLATIELELSVVSEPIKPVEPKPIISTGLKYKPRYNLVIRSNHSVQSQKTGGIPHNAIISGSEIWECFKTDNQSFVGDKWLKVARGWTAIIHRGFTYCDPA